MKRLIVIIGILVVVIAGFLYWNEKNELLELTLTSPHNTAMYNQVSVKLKKEAPVYIEYWEKATGRKFKTCVSASKLEHKFDLLLLKAGTEYEYQIVIDNLFRQKSKVLSFKTREQSPWLVNHWMKEERPHDPDALGDDGFILVCFGRLPGYMALLDNKGDIRWYWQVDDIGVRAASITPRGTILAMLRPFVKDFIDDEPMTPEEVRNEEHKKPMRRGSIGFAGGTGLAEISLTGETLWRLDLNKIEKEKEYQVIHHDIWMDEACHLYTMYRPKKVADVNIGGKMQRDTLGGDGIMMLDTLGNVLKTWSAWDVWDINKDPYISRYMYDRFHMNGFCFDKDSNYLVSVPIEDQIWKIERNTGKLLWKLGRGGDFKMDTTAYFSFQHTPYINPNGDLMLFNNGLYHMQSGALAFKLDEKKRTAETTLRAMLPKDKYTSRMGSAYLMPNGNILQCSSKTGSVLITDQKGKVLWEIVLSFAPYRALYVPADLFKKYFTEIK